MTGDESVSALLQAINERNPRERPKLVAIALRAYTREDGYFDRLPRDILQDAIPRKGLGYASGKASRLIEELRKTGWLENRQTINGAPGLWYLNVERLNPADDTSLMVQAVQAVSDVRKSYPDPKLRQLIVELLGREEA